MGHGVLLLWGVSILDSGTVYKKLLCFDLRVYFLAMLGLQLALHEFGFFLVPPATSQAGLGMERCSAGYIDTQIRLDCCVAIHIRFLFE